MNLIIKGKKPTVSSAHDLSVLITITITKTYSVSGPGSINTLYTLSSLLIVITTQEAEADGSLEHKTSLGNMGKSYLY